MASGGSGVDFLMGEGNVDLLLALTGSLYDLVSWDPRGVGQKTLCVLYSSLTRGVLMST